MPRPGGLAAAVVVAAAFLTTGSPAGAADKPPCEQFAWPLDQEKAWFSGNLGAIRSGASIKLLADGAFAVELVPASTVPFVLPPESPPKNDKSNGAIVTFGGAAPGRYQVTLSDEAWIDMVQDNAYRPSTEHTGVHGCPGLRKSVHFDLTHGSLTVQLSGASTSRLAIAISRIK